MGEETPDTQRRGRGFPIMPLAEAREILVNAARFGREHHIDAFAGYMGHQKASGGAFNNRIAAIRDWNLIERAGGRIVLTDLGSRIAFPTDEAQASRDLREAFLSCEIMREAYERSAKGQPLSLEAFGNAATLNLGVSPGRRDKFVKSFVSSATVVGLAEAHGDGTVMLLAPEDSSPSAGAAVSAQTDVAAAPATPVEHQLASHAVSQSPASASAAVSEPAYAQQLRFAGGVLSVRLDLEHGTLPRKAYVHINTALAELLDVLEEDGAPDARVTRGASSASPPTADAASSGSDSHDAPPEE